MFRLLGKIAKSFALGYCLLSSQQRYTFSNFQIPKQFSSSPNLINDLLLQLSQAEKENDKQNLLTIYEKLASAYKEKGDLNQAMIWGENYVSLSESIQGSGHPTLERWYINLGENFRTQGNLEKAIEYLTKASKIQIEKYGEHSKEVAEIFMHIASCYLLANETDKAEQALKKGYNYMIQHENDGYLAAAVYFQYSGVVASKKSEFSKSIENFQKSRKIFEKASGKDSIEIANTDENLANQYLKANRKEDAKLCYQSAINVRERLRNCDLWLYTRLIMLLADLNNNKEIDETVEKAVKVIQNEHGKNRFSLANFYLELGQKLQAAGKPKMSSKFLDKSFEAVENIPNQNTIEIAIAYQKIGIEVAKMQENEKIIKCLQKALTIKAYLGISQDTFVNSWYSLGVAYFELKNYENAELYLLKAKEAFEQRDSAKMTLVKCLYYLAILYRDTGKYANSAELYKRSIDLNCEVRGKNYPELASDYEELGLIYKRWDKKTEALDSFWTSIEINNKRIGKDSLPNATSYLHIGDIYHDLEKYEKAIECHKKSIDIRIAAHGDEDKYRGISYYKLALDYRKLKNWDIAEEYYKKGIESDIRQFGDKEVHAGRGYSRLGFMYEAKGDKDTALENYKMAERIYLRSPSYNKEELIKIQSKIEELNKSA